MSSKTPDVLVKLMPCDEKKDNGNAKSDEKKDNCCAVNLSAKGDENGIQSRTGSTFRNVLSKLHRIAPFIWPTGDRWLQFKVVLSVLILIIGRLVNLCIPVLAGWIVDEMSVKNFCWDLVIIYSTLRFLQGGAAAQGGALNTLRTYLWIRVEQFTTLRLQTDLYEHLQNLSLRWHLGRRTGEVLRVMERGSASVSSLLQSILFRIVPTFVDILISIVYFVSAFNAWFGLIVGIIMAVYIVVTYGITEWRTRIRREMNLRSNASNTKAVDGLLNFETVKYFTAEKLEVNRFKDALRDYQKYEYLSNATLTLLNSVQNVTISVGLLTGTVLCAHMVTVKETLTVGDYVLFSSYIMQLYQPLNWLGTYYRQIQQSFVDMENMLDLFESEQEVTDAPDAIELAVSEGRLVVDNLSFAYEPERPVLRGISFVAEPGMTVAFVGPTGSGKSTLIRLIFRFYDVTSGQITIDGTNIAKVTQSSLRQQIGVVPQDTVLFNDTIRFNIAYGRPGTCESKLTAAAKASDIHQRVLSFPDGYDTRVGERGLKLSGGEKQRVAIARTLLKAPPIVLLDEATSALDTRTERNIQAALKEATAGRTTLMVAHRLSSVIHSDLICVLHEGQIVERGRHSDLVKAGGVYAGMWAAQLSHDGECYCDSAQPLEREVVDQIQPSCAPNDSCCA